MVNKGILKSSCICLLWILMIILSTHSLSATANPMEPGAFNQVYLPPPDQGQTQSERLFSHRARGKGVCPLTGGDFYLS